MEEEDEKCGGPMREIFVHDVATLKNLVDKKGECIEKLAKENQRL